MKLINMHEKRSTLFNNYIYKSNFNEIYKTVSKGSTIPNKTTQISYYLNGYRLAFMTFLSNVACNNKQLMYFYNYLVQKISTFSRFYLIQGEL